MRAAQIRQARAERSRADGPGNQSDRSSASPLETRDPGRQKRGDGARRRGWQKLYDLGCDRSQRLSGPAHRLSDDGNGVGRGTAESRPARIVHWPVHDEAGSFTNESSFQKFGRDASSPCRWLESLTMWNRFAPRLRRAIYATLEEADLMQGRMLPSPNICSYAILKIRRMPRHSRALNFFHR